MKKISTLAIVFVLSISARAQLINAFNGESLSGYTTTLVLDNSLGGGSGVSFSDTTGGLVASFSGATSDPEQALFLTPTALPVGDALVMNTTIPVSSTTEDFGLALSSTATPTAAGSGNGYNSRTNFDWTSISVRPSQTAIRVNTSISGVLTTSGGVLTATPTAVSELFIESLGNDQFELGYVNSGNSIVNDETITFGNSSTIGAAIGIYGDIRTTGTSLGSLSDLTIEPINDVPEPSSLAFFGVGGLLGLAGWVRRKK
jgi:hypothetical protein